MDDARTIPFFIGLAFMVVGLLSPAYPPARESIYSPWIWRLGLTIAFAAHAWPT